MLLPKSSSSGSVHQVQVISTNLTFDGQERWQLHDQNSEQIPLEEAMTNQRARPNRSQLDGEWSVSAIRPAADRFRLFWKEFANGRVAGRPGDLSGFMS
jgi:hypothetical protein